MLNWLYGYDNAGNWQPSRSKAALEKHPLTNKKKQTNSKKASEPPSKSTSSKNPSEPDSNPASKSSASSKKKPPPPDKNQSQPPSSERIMRSFPLNVAHAIPATPDKLFNSYFVPYDGNCLFSSFKNALQLQSTIQQLRIAVVQNISDEANPQIRISCLNTHIAREQEHHNPAWQDVDLLDAGTVFVPGELDIQFSHLWVKYADEMSDNAWAGTHNSFCIHSFFLYLILFSFQASLRSWLSATSTTAIALFGKLLPNMVRWCIAIW
jgi:hypothetical protein